MDCLDGFLLLSFVSELLEEIALEKLLGWPTVLGVVLEQILKDMDHFFVLEVVVVVV